MTTCGDSVAGKGGSDGGVTEEPASSELIVGGAVATTCLVGVVDRPGFACATYPARAPIKASAANPRRHVSCEMRRRPPSRAATRESSLGLSGSSTDLTIGVRP